MQLRGQLQFVTEQLQAVAPRSRLKQTPHELPPLPQPLPHQEQQQRQDPFPVQQLPDAAHAAGYAGALDADLISLPTLPPSPFENPAFSGRLSRFALDAVSAAGQQQMFRAGSAASQPVHGAVDAPKHAATFAADVWVPARSVPVPATLLPPSLPPAGVHPFQIVRCVRCARRCRCLTRECRTTQADGRQGGPQSLSWQAFISQLDQLPAALRDPSRDLRTEL